MGCVRSTQEGSSGDPGCLLNITWFSCILWVLKNIVSHSYLFSTNIDNYYINQFLVFQEIDILTTPQWPLHGYQNIFYTLKVCVIKINSNFEKKQNVWTWKRLAAVGIYKAFLEHWVWPPFEYSFIIYHEMSRSRNFIKSVKNAVLPVRFHWG